jgi:hypothetical protein
MAADPPRKEGEGPPLLGGKADGGLRSYSASNQVKEPRRPLGPGKLAPSLRNAHNGPTIDEL